MSKSTENNPLLSQYRVFRVPLNLNLFKTTSCCNEYSCLHIKYVMIFSSIIDPSYEFCSSKYTDDNNTKLHCFVCENNGLYCCKKHNMNPKGERLLVHVWCKCNKAWYCTYDNCNTYLTIWYVKTVLKRKEMMYIRLRLRH